MRNVSLKVLEVFVQKRVRTLHVIHRSHTEIQLLLTLATLFIYFLVNQESVPYDKVNEIHQRLGF